MVSIRLFYWLWAGWLLYFAAIEGVAVWHEFRDHRGDSWTFTHFLAAHVPVYMRVILIVWLFYHFVIVHKRW
jgi:hypothetical protein